MNREAVKNEIAKIAAAVATPIHKQYKAAKHQIAKLTELGIIELMPSNFGYQTAARVIDAATDAGGSVGGFNDAGEGDIVRQGASNLYDLINAEEATKNVAPFRKGQVVKIAAHEVYRTIFAGADHTPAQAQCEPNIEQAVVSDCYDVSEKFGVPEWIVEIEDGREFSAQFVQAA